MRRPLIAAFVLALPSVGVACLWDYDTLKQERSRFPDTLEIITGKFLRHSPEFYEWRIKDRLAKLKSDPGNPALHDDLAVAYAKTGQYGKAIATMEALEKIAPGRYETYSNLGTFHFLAGDIEKALPIIDKALAINPDAHFGREKYQRWLGEYVLSRKFENGKLEFPLRLGYPVPEELKGASKDFEEFVRKKLGDTGNLSPEHRQEAIKGVLGMMRFADHASPLLLEALGDLLSGSHHPTEDGKRLAVRAYLKAAQAVTDPAARAAYRRHAQQVLIFQTRHAATESALQVEEVETRLAAEVSDADSWYADLKAKELGWIESGADPEAEFDKLYVEPPSLEDEPTDAITRSPWNRKSRTEQYMLVAGVIVTILVLGLTTGIWYFTRRPKR